MKNDADFYIELSKKEESKIIKVLDEKDIPGFIMNGIDDYLYRRFFITTFKKVNLNSCIYDQMGFREEVIVGSGGRETDEIIECIYLNTMLKYPDKKTTRLFRKIVDNLKNNILFRQGFATKGYMHKKALYNIDVLEKIKRYDISKPLSKLIIEDLKPE